MKSKTKIKQQTRRKTNSELVETIDNAKKQKSWLKLAGLLSSSTRKVPAMNLDQIDKQTKEGDTLLIPGKVLGDGNISKKLRIVALSFSDSAMKKLKNKKCEAIKISEEIKLNPKAEGIKLLH